VSSDLYDDPPGFEDEYGDDLHPEGPSPEDLARFGDEYKICPACRNEVYDQVELCPVCGHAFEDRPVRLGPIVILVTTILLLALLILFLF
jgi:hypothetical protein